MDYQEQLAAGGISGQPVMTGNDGTYHFRKGQVLTLQAVLRAGIVQRPGQRP